MYSCRLLLGLMVVAVACDEPLLERLRVLVTDPSTDESVKAKAIELFRSWSHNYKDSQGMEKLIGLKGQIPTRVSFR